MKLRLLVSALAVSATLAAIPAEAAGVFSQSRDNMPRVNIYKDAYSYAGIDMMNWNISTPNAAGDGTDKGSARGTRLSFGQRFDEFIAAEVQFGMGGSDTTATIKMDHTLSLFVKGVIPMNRLQVKGLLGYSATQFEHADETKSVSSISFGLGAELNVWRDAYINADYIKYISTTNNDMDAISIGAGYRF